MVRMSAPRVAVLGGTGFIGRWVTRRLAAAGADVTALQRRAAEAAAGLRALTADRHDAAQLRDALAAASPGVVVDVIAYAADDAGRLLEALPSSVERLVLISSADVYWTYAAFLGLSEGVPPTRPLDERAPVRAVRYPYRAQAKGPDDLLYRYEKLDVEDALRESGVPVTVLRLPMVYGPGDRQQRVAGCLARFEASGGALRLNAAEAAWRCTRGYVEDVAAAVALAALDPRAAGATYNVGEPDALTECEWIEAVGRAAGWRGEVIVDAATPPSLPARWEFPLVTDTSRIRSELGFELPVGRDDGLRRTIANSAEHGLHQVSE